MPFVSGVFQRVYSWVNDKNANIDITASRFDTEDDGFATGLSTCILKDGTQTVTANIPFAAFKITGLGSGSARTDSVNLGQVEDGTVNWIAAAGSADAITAGYAPAITALVDGQLCFFRASAANATTTPTFSPNGLTARTITKRGGAALIAGDIPGNLAEIGLRYNLANTRWELINPAVAKQPTRTVKSTGSGTYTTPSGATRLHITMIGGGGGGAGGGTTTTAGSGGPGADTTFSTLTAAHGSAGSGAGNSTGGAGGSATGGDINISGGVGGTSCGSGTAAAGAAGAASPFGGGGAGGTPVGGSGGDAPTNSGAGGGAAGNTAGGVIGGGGGGAGGYVWKLLLAPAATYSYSVGAGGTAGAAGSGGNAGGIGGSGIIIIDEFYN